MERDGEPLEKYPIRTLYTGITFRRVFPGMVPEIEERDAAVFGRYTWMQWQKLPLEERAAGIAHYRIHYQITLHQQDVQDRESKRQVAQAKTKGSRG